jgi:hypothetical protein
MGVSLTGSRGLSLAKIKSASAVLGVAVGVGAYLYGPAVTPVMHAAALSSCNELTGGDFRSYRLDWVVDTRPHWNCWDSRSPDKAPVNLGWWVIGR